MERGCRDRSGRQEKWLLAIGPRGADGLGRLEDARLKGLQTVTDGYSRDTGGEVRSAGRGSLHGSLAVRDRRASEQ